MYIQSPAFDPEQNIPEPHTCNQRNISPPLEFGDIPSDAQTLVLMFEDIDAPADPWVHWLVFNIPVSTTSVAEGSIPQGGTEGLANGGTHGYEGPCPKYFTGTHRYVFKLYALDAVLPLDAQVDRQKVLRAMRDHIIAEAQLVGTKVGDGSAMPESGD